MADTSARGIALPSLTSLRAAAALLVFAHHLGTGFFPWDLNSYGYVGVTFFYVLSGFVLTWGATSAGGLSRFYTRRFFRIYPSHLAVTLVALSMLTLLAGFNDAKIAIAQLLLIQAWSPDITTVWGLNGVTWSLSCEFFFYLLFPFLVRSSARLASSTFLAVAGVLLGLEAVFTVIASHTVENGELWMVAGANPVVRLPEFILGIALARFAKSGRRLHWSVCVAVVSVCTAGFCVASMRPAPDAWAAPLVGLVILFFAGSDASGRRLLAWRPLVYAGEVSFSFYLVHQLVLNYVGPRLGGATGWVEACLTLSISIASAIALHHVVEKPAFSILTRRTEALLPHRRATLEPAVV